MEEEEEQTAAGDEGESSGKDDDPKPQGAIARKLRSWWWGVHSRFPNIVPSPYGNDLEYWREKDPKDNKASRIPDDQNISLGCVWACEVYGPAEIDGLYVALKRLGWDEERSRSDRNRVSWIKHQRSYGSEGVVYLGIIHRGKESLGSSMARYSSSIPREFDALIVDIHQVSPSLTCLVVGFVLSEEHSSKYAVCLNSSFVTSRHSVKGTRSVTIKNVEHHKRDALVEIRRKYRRLAIDWLSSHLPGFFAAAGNLDAIPSGELLLPEGYSAFDAANSGDVSRLNWANFLDLDSRFDFWVNEKCPPIKFSFARREFEDLNHIVVSLTWSSLSEDDLKFQSGESLSAKSYFVHEKFSGIWAKYSAVCYLKEVRRSLAELRERIQGSNRTRDEGLSTLESVERFMAKFVGTPTIASELSKLSKNDGSFRWNSSGYRYRSAFEEQEKKPNDISDGLKFMLKRLSSTVISEDRDTRQYFAQYSSIIGTRESVKAQRKMEKLTVTAILVSSISLLVAVFALLRGGG